MPPRRGIVRSGNAGNSSKSSKAPEPGPPQNPEDKPLFPPGSKFPLSLLNERCQKNGWERPIVDTRKQGNEHAFSVTLSRINKKTSQKESVRLEPHPPYLCPTALEARHWGATYALYRFCNGIQLNRVLPPGPRDYWNTLAAEHKSIPEHQAWMYDADPFAARKAVDERQAKATQKATSSQNPRAEGSGQTSSEFSNAPEAKMAGSLRDLVEDAVKRAINLYPEIQDTSDTAVLTSEDTARLLQQLQQLNFTLAQSRNAITAMSSPSPLSTHLLRALPPLQACIEYLILHVPECDLPQRFLPTNNSSNPFVTSTHSGTDDLKRRWMEDKAVKECGWPAHVVKECMSDSSAAEDWGRLVAALNRRLLGVSAEDTDTSGTMEVVDPDEVEALQGHFTDFHQLILPLPMAPMALNIIASPEHSLPTQGVPPPMYITSLKVPAYVRLHLLSKLLIAFSDGTLIASGESLLMAAVSLLEEEWAFVEDNGPPPMSEVLKHLLPQKLGQQPADTQATSSGVSSQSKSGNQRRNIRKDDRTDLRIKDDFEELRRRPQYAQLLSVREKLPAFSSKEQFLTLLERHQCVVVVGETGCGKTTQLPQFVLDSLILANRGSKASILVTQPRRLSAIGVAARVSSERLDDGSVGYAIRGESKQDKRTKLLFCTTGVVLRRLGSGDTLRDVTHVIVDEVHERSVDGDLLLLELKELLKTHRELKVILMSATINHEVFMRYFNNAPLLSIPGLTYPVEDKFLEDIIPSLKYRPPGSKSVAKFAEDIQELSKEGNLDEASLRAIQYIQGSDRIDYDLIAAIVEHTIATAPKRGAILIFLTGVQEIRQCVEMLKRISGTRVLPLHANLTNDEQRLVFAPTTEWKIVVSTNVAETSITIDDVIYVIDSGKVKETHYDNGLGLTKLEEQWITQAAARQRRGRAGRTQPGVCYKLYTRAHHRKMTAFPIPEIKRVPLESISLTAKVVHRNVKSFLSRAIDPPDMAAIDNALSTLQDLAALDSDGDLTALGRHMAMLPVDLRLGKMLILGAIFRCLNPILTVSACLSCKPLFYYPMDKREATQARARFATGNSDLLTDVKAYDECARIRKSAFKSFCDENFISVSALRDITSLRLDFLSSLSDLGFIPRFTKADDPALNANSTNENLVKAVILGGFWPRVARVSLPKSAIKFDKVQGGTVQRENTAKEFKIYDLKEGRVFLHPASILFHATAWKSPFLTYFQKRMTSKVFLVDATEVPIYGLLLFGGPVAVNHVGGGLTIGSKDSWIRLKAWPRIGVLVNQLRRLLDAKLKRCIEDGTTLVGEETSPVLEAILALLSGDGLTTL